MPATTILGAGDGAPSSSPGGGPAPSNRRVLIVDDNRAIHDDFRKILAEPPGAASALAELEAVLFGQERPRPAPEAFALDSAFQGEEGYELVRRARDEGRPYALAFVDVRMPPGWDGVETAFRICESDPEIQIVICTAYSDYSWEETVERLSDAGERFLILKKPFDHIEVRQLAAALTRKWQLARQARASIDELEAAVRARTATLREAHERLQAELGQRHRVEAQLRRAQKLEALGRLAAGIAHEINNPLAFVIANMQFAREALQPAAASAGTTGAGARAAGADEIVAALEEACVGGDRIKQIVRDLKAFAQPHDESLAVVDLKPVIEFSAKMAGAEIRPRARLSVTVDEHVPRVWAIGGRLEQVLVNLLVNAAHAIPPGRPQDHEIAVRAHALPSGGAGRGASGESVAVEISDTGVGIPASNLERIFDPFFTTKPVGVGTGLGLSICHSIVTAFGGDLTVESVEGKGSTFRVTLPGVARTAEAGAEDGVAATATPRGGRVTTGPLALPAIARILLVDPDPALAKAMRRLLSAHKVEIATGGHEALALCRERAFDLVLYDVAVPDLSPADAYRDLREARPGAERRLVFTTAGALAPELARLLGETGARCLDKPFDAADVELLLATADRSRAG